MDLRIPVGALFTAIGIVLATYGVVAHQSSPVQLGVNVNLAWGLLMFVFGSAFMVSGVLSSRRRMKP